MSSGASPRRNQKRAPPPIPEHIPLSKALAKKFRMCAASNNVSELERLFVNPSLLNAADGGGRVALHYASRDGAGDAVRMLLEWKADPNVTCDDGTNPLDEAEWWYVKLPKRSCCYDYVRLLLERHGATFSQLYLNERRQVLQKWADRNHIPWRLDD